jgi:hypothetical protein
VRTGKTRGPLVNKGGHNLEVDLTEFFDARFSHFEHHVTTIKQPRGMNLTYGGASQWF